MRRLPPSSVRGRRLVLALAVAVGGLATVGVMATHGGSRSYRWASGVYPGGRNDTAAVRAFARFRDRPVDVVSFFPARETWSQYLDRTLLRRYAGYSGRLTVGVALVPQRSSPKELAAVAAGRHDAAFRALGHGLVDQGRGDADLRLGWEFNASWQPWFAENPRVFVAAFRHVALLLRHISRHFTIDWNGNVGSSSKVHSAFAGRYPGDDVVDVIGVDAYDYSPPRGNTFAAWLSQPGGLRDWLAFARKHRKKLAIPEWGVAASARPGGRGDDANFIAGMHAFLWSNARSIAFECYFNGAGTPVGNSLTHPRQMPRSAAAYAMLWKKG